MYCTCVYRGIGIHVVYKHVHGSGIHEGSVVYKYERRQQNAVMMEYTKDRGRAGRRKKGEGKDEEGEEGKGKGRERWKEEEGGGEGRWDKGWEKGREGKGKVERGTGGRGKVASQTVQV